MTYATRPLALACAAALAFALALPTAHAQQYSRNITVTTDQDAEITLTLGFDPDATEGLDAQFGEEELDPYPAGEFDIRFRQGGNISDPNGPGDGPRGAGTLTDIQTGEAPLSESITYPVVAQVAEEGNATNQFAGTISLSFNFDPAQVPTINLVDNFGGLALDTTVTIEEGEQTVAVAVDQAAELGLSYVPVNVTLNYDGAEANPLATITFDDNTLDDGQTVTVASTSIPQDGYVAIHDASLFGPDGEPFTDDDQPLSSVIGVSEYLEAGAYEDLDVTLFDVPGADFPADTSLTGSPTLIAMPHQETNGNEEYNFLTSGGSADAPYLDMNGNAVVSTSTLPVEFAGAPKVATEGREVVLSWRTLSETRNDGFYVDYKRVAAGAGWARANPDARVPSKAENGTSDRAHRYEHRISGLAPGRYVFRVQQVDTDGGRSFSPESVEAEVGLSGFALQSAYPNPVRPGDAATLAFSTGAASAEKVQAVLFNTLGQQVRTLGTRGNALRIDASGLASGLYFVRLKAGGRTATQSVTIVR